MKLGFQKIYKYPINIGITKLDLPLDSEILTTQVDEKTGKPCIWVKFYAFEESRLVQTVISVFPTGINIIQDLTKANYIGTIQLNKGEFVGHVFELLDYVEV